MTTTWTRSEDAGYRPGFIVRDLLNGDLVVVERWDRVWAVNTIRNGVGVKSTTYATRKDALVAAESL